MTALSAFGLFAVTTMLICYAFEDRDPLFILAFAVACALGSTYGFLQGAWPFGLLKPCGRLLRSAAGDALGSHAEQRWTSFLVDHLWRSDSVGAAIRTSRPPAADTPRCDEMRRTER
jgi:hypothetical protein